MKYKKIFLLFILSVTLFIGIGNIKADRVYTLNEQTKNPLHCYYVSQDKEKITFELVYKNEEFTVADYDGVDGTTLEVRFNIVDKSNCPESIKVSLLDSSDTLFVEATSTKYHCGSGKGAFTGIPKKIPELTSFAVSLIQVAVPVILILLGSIDLFKGITAGKEDEMKKGQQVFIKRLVIGALIFFITVIAKFFISIVADSNESNIISCIECFVYNDCEVGYK